MSNLNSEGDTPGESTKRKPRLIKRFEKRPPLKVSDKAQPSTAASSSFKENMNSSTPATEVTGNVIDVLKQNLFANEYPNEYKNLVSAQAKHKISFETPGKTMYGDTTPANDRLYSLLHKLRVLEVCCKSDEELKSQNDLLSSKNKRKAPTNDASNKAVNESQDKNQMWSLSSTIWSPEVQVKSKEISCSLSLQGTLILTNMYSGSLCSTKEYSKPTLLKPLNVVKDNNWELSNKIWSPDQLSLDNKRSKVSDKFSQSNSSGTVSYKNGLSSEKENNLFEASQAQQPTASVHQKTESQFTQQPASEYEDNSISAPMKKSQMTKLLERLRSEAHSEHPQPDTASSPPKPSKTSSSSSTPCKSKSPSCTASPASRAASNGSHSSPGHRLRAPCFNCGLDDHRHFNCPQPLTHSFCHRCGWEDVSSDACPFCTGTLVRPGSKQPVPVGGDARRKFDSVDLEQTREEYMMKVVKKSKKY